MNGPEDEIKIKDEAEADALMAAEWGQQPGNFSPKFLEYQALVKSNFRKNIKLSQQGVQMQDISLLFTRLEMLIEFCFPKGEEDRLDFELLWQKQMQTDMEKFDNELQQARKAAGKPDLQVVKKGGLIVPGRG